MSTPLRRFGGVVAALMACLPTTGCRRPGNAALAAPLPPDTVALPTTGPTTTFSSGKLGIAIDYPRSWVVRKNDDYELFLLPPGSPESRSISLDVPDLPFHIPGMIPMRSVQNGYVDDVKKQFGAVTIEQLTPPKLDKCSVRVVKCAGQSKGHGIVDMALLIVHNDHVYIVRATADAAGEPEVHAAFDAIVRSLRWVKP